MTALTLRLPEPPSANRWWRNVNGRMVTSKAARDYKDRVWIMSAAKCLTMIAAPTPVTIYIDWYRSRRAGDLDKRIGVALDALQGVMYENDSQIVAIRARRFDPVRGTPGGFVDIIVEPANMTDPNAAITPEAAA